MSSSTKCYVFTLTFICIAIIYSLRFLKKIDYSRKGTIYENVLYRFGNDTIIKKIYLSISTTREYSLSGYRPSWLSPKNNLDELGPVILVTPA